MAKILIIRTEIDRKKDLVDIKVLWDYPASTKLEEDNFYTTNCPHCDESLEINVLVKLINDAFKEEFEPIEAEYLTENEEIGADGVVKEEFQTIVEDPGTFDELIEECDDGEDLSKEESDHKLTSNGDTDFSFECEVCKMNFASSYSYRLHKNIHTNKFECKICGIRFIKGERLKTHMKKHSEEQQELAIKLEREEILEKAKNLIKPVLEVTPERATLCPTCGKSFSTTASYFAHTQTAHKPRSYECDYCGRVLKSRKTFKHHLIRAHSDKNDPSLLLHCDFCPAAYFLKRDLRIHLRAKHVPKEKKFTCEICQHAFIYKRELLDHLRTHQDQQEGRHKCGICDKTFNRLSAKKDHLAIHSSERNFSCSFCGQKYKRKSYLTIHERIHTGYRPYRCKKDNCSARFYDSGSFRQHRLMHERKERKVEEQ